jgi:hypothetical protein
MPMLLHNNLIFDTEFADYLMIGWDHIIDVKAYDHLLFIMVLCAIFTMSEWRKILVIVTAFTIGHSLTLALSALQLVEFPQKLIEILIPCTILATSASNVIKRRKDIGAKTFDSKLWINYSGAMFFGLIHGLGFANNFKFLLEEESSIIKQLFAFNSGLELGQIAVVACFMLLLFLVTRFSNIVHREWTLFISGAGAGISVILILDAL